jgi:hypothetical protein
MIMGWGFGFENGRNIGYGINATCDRRGCNEEIDRGLGWRCGGALNLTDDSYGCGMYFCEKHLGWVGPRGGCTHRQRKAWGKEI